MCLLVLSFRVDAELPLVLAANRDEYYRRASLPAHFWPQHPGLLAGQDLELGGTWLGLHKTGRFAAVTNYRQGKAENRSVRSRGVLVRDYLVGDMSTEAYLQQCIDSIHDFNGFNLLLGDVRNLYFLSSRARVPQRLGPGHYGLSNGDLDSSWPKVKVAKQGLGEIIGSAGSDVHEALMTLLRDRRVADDDRLPDTGVGLARERELAPIFINSAEYGTRASTVITIDRQGRARFSERNYDNNAALVNEVAYEFVIEEIA